MQNLLITRCTLNGESFSNLSLQLEFAIKADGFNPQDLRSLVGKQVILMSEDEYESLLTIGVDEE